MNVKLTILKPETISVKLEMTATLEEWELIRDELHSRSTKEPVAQLRKNIDIVLRKVRAGIDSKSAWEEMVDK